MSELNITLSDYAVMNIMIWNKLEKRKQFAYMISYQNIQKLLFNIISNG